MYAIIEDSGSQIMVRPGDVVRVALREMPSEAATLTFDKVLLVNPNDPDTDAKSKVNIGTPYVKGGKVTAELISQERTPRVEVVKFRRRKGYLRRKGHRQDYLKVRITSIDS